MTLPFEHWLERWRSCPLDSRDRIMETLSDTARKLGNLPGSEQDVITTYRLIAVMQNLPDLQDIEWLNAQRSRALGRLKADSIAQTDEVQQVAAAWSVVDGDGLDP